MALIGTMKYLTIGNQTYEIAGDELQIASASTLGGIKVGSGLSIDSTTGVLSTSITETDPVFAASAAAGITSTDISNWNAKVSDDKTWNGVSLTKGDSSNNGTIYIPFLSSSTGTTANITSAVSSPSASRIAKYDISAYLYSTTPSANDNSTKVATTAYVDAAIPDTSGFVNKSGDTMTGNLTFADGKGITLSYSGQTDTLKLVGYGSNFRVANFSTQTILRNIYTPDSDTAAANKKYVDDSIGAISVPTKTSDLTNDSGFITGLTILSYGSSTWNDFITAYNANKIVYCRASSGADPATGSQTRLATMLYLNNAESPTEVEFQYYRSVSNHTDTQQGDQIYVYKLNSSGTWSVMTRNTFTKIVASGDLSSSYSDGVLTLSATIPTAPTITLNGTSTTTPSFYAPTTAGTNGYFLKSNGSGAPTWAEIETTAAQIVRW